MKVAAVGSKSIIGDFNQNLSITMSWIKKLNAQGVDFILFPELNLTGFTRNVDVLETACKERAWLFKKLLDLSSVVNSAFAIGFPEWEEDKIFITHFVFEGGTLLGKHRKTHLSSNEKEVFSEGDKISVFQVKGMILGIQLCYETHFPELSYIQQRKGADVLAMAFASPRESSAAKINRLKRYIPARAYDNSCFIMLCNQETINENGTLFPGLSFVLDPKGELLCESLSADVCSIAELDFHQIQKIKKSKMADFNQAKRTEWLMKYYG
ncbi:nitrilase-related carbon-nitrogen hydrolase [Marinifilum caeruleilacunae]|uniref:CN hydrolase domain-containing protein n=1 Tax=Marinifilum caeruleilacunae TaxID=2499076 RepID=A0ABX1WYL5_9BACT|nr:nitrilase-related carbon-nitrogen hydrolase [Marinifilum caeruleilacunae]NOU61127.1 hypothetical protein [Marinifilum caeruleilacunae]